MVSHLRRVCGPGVGSGELEALAAEALASYGRYWAESLRLPGVAAPAVLADLEIRGLEVIDAALGGGRGVLLALPHLGGWEWGGRYLVANGYATSVVVEALEPPEVLDWFAGLRRRLGMEVIPVGSNALVSSVAALSSNRVLCLLSDRVVPGVAAVEVDFFGAPARLPVGPVVLALRTGAPLVPAAVYFQKGTPGHRAVVRRPLPLSRRGRFRDDVIAGTQLLAREMEVLVRAAPTQWHVLQPIWPGDTALGRGDC